MELAKFTWFRLKAKTNIESGVSCCLNQYQLGKCQDIFILPNLQLLEFLDVLQELLAQEWLLVEPGHPEEVVVVHRF